MCLLCIRANKPYINNKVAYLAKWCSWLALLADMHILTATLSTVYLHGPIFSQSFYTILTVL